MKNISLSLLAILSLFLFSCKKETSNDQKTENELTGTWNLLYFVMEGQNSIELSSEDLGSIHNIVYMDYLSTNNKGSITFEENKIKSNELSYDITGTINLKEYIDGMLVNSFDSTVNIPMPASSSTNDFVRVTADSIYLPNSSLITIEGAEDLYSKPGGIKYKFDGDKLILTARQKESGVIIEDGITQETKSDATMVMTLQK